MKIIGFFCVLGIFFLSCSDLKKGDQLGELQALNKTVDSVEVVLLENQIDTLENIKLTMRMLEYDISKLKSSDSIPYDFALKMDEYKWMRKSIPVISKNQVALKTGIKEVRMSLKNLETDISNASGRKDKYENYIRFERKKVGQLRSTLTETAKLRDKLLKDFDSTHNEIKQFLKNKRG